MKRLCKASFFYPAIKTASVCLDWWSQKFLKVHAPSLSSCSAEAGLCGEKKRAGGTLHSPVHGTARPLDSSCLWAAWFQLSGHAHVCGETTRSCQAGPITPDSVHSKSRGHLSTLSRLLERKRDCRCFRSQAKCTAVCFKHDKRGSHSHTAHHVLHCRTRLVKIHLSKHPETRDIQF